MSNQFCPPFCHHTILVRSQKGASIIQCSVDMHVKSKPLFEDRRSSGRKSCILVTCFYIRMLCESEAITENWNTELSRPKCKKKTESEISKKWRQTCFWVFSSPLPSMQLTMPTDTAVREFHFAITLVVVYLHVFYLEKHLCKELEAVGRGGT